MSPLDPRNLTPDASLNRVRVMDLPDLAVDAGVKGKTGYELVSAQTLAQLIRPYCSVFQLDPSLSDRELNQAFDRCLSGDGSSNPSVRKVAEAIAQRIGRNLGYLLLTLKRGDWVNREAREEWDTSYWDHWAGINNIRLGGGLVNGGLGQHIKRHVLAVFEEAGITDFGVVVSPYGENLAMVGVARTAPPDIETALVFDMGGTMIKRGCAVYDDYRRELLELRCLPPVPTQWKKFERTLPSAEDAAAALLGHIVAAITRTWRSIRANSDLPLTRVVRISMASYIRDGHPMVQRGAYGHLRELTQDLQSELILQLIPHLGVVDLKLMHDGTAAAAAYAGGMDAAVISIGTALGIGFPPPEDAVCRISEDFIVTDLE
jgi:hypothetical protein